MFVSEFTSIICKLISITGMRFGLVQTKFAIATILKNFKILPETKTKRPLRFDITSSANENQGGIWVKYEKL